MTEHSIKVFENPELLREKLGIFLQKPKKVELYAQAAEKFFNNGNKQNIKASPTWSWWGFFFNIGFLLYRKDKLNACILIFIWLLWCVISNIIVLNSGNTIIVGLFNLVVVMIFCVVVGLYGKYCVIKRFEKALDDNELEKRGGTSFLSVIISIIVIIAFNIAFTALIGYLYQDDIKCHASCYNAPLAFTKVHHLKCYYKHFKEVTNDKTRGVCHDTHFKRTG